MHLYYDHVLNPFATINDTITLPQGTIGALSWSLAELLMPEYGEMEPAQIALVTRNAAIGRSLIKRTNMHPQMPSQFDQALQVRTRQNAAWILSGGF